MEEKDNIIVKWAQEYVETSYNLLNIIICDISYSLRQLRFFTFAECFLLYKILL